MRFQCKTANPCPGTERQYLRFDGRELKVYGYPRLDKVVQEGKRPAICEDRMTVMIGDGKVPGFAQQGCWLSCHDGQRDMPKQFTRRSGRERAADRVQEERRAQIAVAFDPALPWKEGDMIPDYVTSREDAKGSAADAKAVASWKDGTWTAVMIRPLGLNNGDDKALKEGAVCNVGFAVHDDNITTRGHFVSFVKTLPLGAAGVKADITAVKLP